MNAIGYYCDTNIPLIAEIEQKYGSMLQGIKYEQKIFLISELSGQLEALHLHEHSQEFYDLACKFNEEITEETDAIGLLKALVNAL